MWLSWNKINCLLRWPLIMVIYFTFWTIGHFVWTKAGPVEVDKRLDDIIFYKRNLYLAKLISEPLQSLQYLFSSSKVYILIILCNADIMEQRIQKWLLHPFLILTTFNPYLAVKLKEDTKIRIILKCALKVVDVCIHI